MLTLYPAIDLMGGRCVRLTQGDFTRQSHYQNEPEELAQRYRQAGCEWLHIIDLDAAKSRGKQQQLGMISHIIDTCKLRIQCGGGIQSSEHLQKIFDAGVERAIIGSLCVKQPAQVREWLSQFGAERIALALDINYCGGASHHEGEPYMAIHGWQELSSKTLWQLLQEFPEIKHLLCTDIAKDGTLEGPNFQLYQRILQQYPNLALQASGGIATLSDLQSLNNMGLAGAVLGKSLLEGRFTIGQALEQARTASRAQ